MTILALVNRGTRGEGAAIAITFKTQGCNAATLPKPAIWASSNLRPKLTHERASLPIWFAPASYSPECTMINQTPDIDPIEFFELEEAFAATIAAIAPKKQK